MSGDNIVPCLEVPVDAKEAFRNEQFKKKIENLTKEFGSLSPYPSLNAKFLPPLPRKKMFFLPHIFFEPYDTQHAQTFGLGSEKCLKKGITSKN